MLQTLFNTSVSTTTIFGTVVSEIESSLHQSTLAVVRFSVRVSPDKSKSQVKLTPYIRAFAFGSNADFIKNKVKNGAPIFIRGKLVDRSRISPEGELYKYNELEVRDIAVIG